MKGGWKPPLQNRTCRMETLTVGRSDLNWSVKIVCFEFHPSKRLQRYNFLSYYPNIITYYLKYFVKVSDKKRKAASADCKITLSLLPSNRNVFDSMTAAE